jgi:hypothetical protein
MDEGARNQAIGGLHLAAAVPDAVVHERSACIRALKGKVSRPESWQQNISTESVDKPVDLCEGKTFTLRKMRRNVGGDYLLGMSGKPRHRSPSQRMQPARLACCKGDIEIFVHGRCIDDKEKS